MRFCGWIDNLVFVRYMDYVLVILAVVLVLAGIVGSIVPALPGPPLSYVGLLLMNFTRWGDFSTQFIVIWALVTVAITVIDLYLPIYMTKRFGGSRYATVGTAIGTVAGLFLIPPFGILIFPFLGALAGELVHDSSNGPKALRVAFGSWVAFLTGTGAKLLVACMMAFFALKAVVTALFI